VQELKQKKLIDFSKFKLRRYASKKESVPSLCPMKTAVPRAERIKIKLLGAANSMVGSIEESYNKDSVKRGYNTVGSKRIARLNTSPKAL
jgi:hypothetical protein